MALTIAELPDNFLKCLDAKTRRSLGVQTSDEANKKFELRKEKELQSAVSQYLSYQRSNGVCEFIIPPMHKRSELPEGWPDLTLFVKGKVYLVEFKTEKGKVRPEQLKKHEDLNKIGFETKIIRSIQDFLAFWRNIEK